MDLAVVGKESCNRAVVIVHYIWYVAVDM